MSKEKIISNGLVKILIFAINKIYFLDLYSKNKIMNFFFIIIII